MRFVLTITALSTLFTLAPEDAAADCPTIRRNNNRVIVVNNRHHDDVVVVRQINTAYYPQGYNYPVSVGYNPDVTKELLDQNKALTSVAIQQAFQLGQAQGGGTLPPSKGGVGPQANLALPAAKVPAHAALAKQYCASCHGATPMGSKLSFFDAAGNYLEPADDVLEKMIVRVNLDPSDPKSMPKGGKMTDRERLNFASSLALYGGREAAAKALKE